MKIKGIYREHLFISKFFIFLGLLLTGFGLSIVLGFILAGPLFGVDLLNNPSALADFDNPDQVSALKFMQLLNSVGIFAFPPIAFAYMTSDNWKKYLDLNLGPNKSLMFITVVLMIATLPLINLLIELNESMNLPDFLHGIEHWMREKEESAKGITENFMKMNGFSDYLVNLLVIGLAPAIGEELIFRGVLQKQIGMRTGNHHIGIWAAAFLFSAIHIQFYGFMPRMMLGVLFGYLFVWSGSLWIPILGHLVNNGGAVTVQYFLGEKFTEEQLDTIGTGTEDWLFIALSVLFTTYLLILFWRNRVM